MVITGTELYGVDLQLVDGDLDLSPTGGFKVVSSNENLLQAIINRLKTETGSLAYDASYGVDLNLIVGEKNSIIKQQLIKSLILTALKNEPRIASIDALSIIPDNNRGDILYINIQITPIFSETPLGINLVYPFYLNQSNVKVTSEPQTSISKYVVKTSYTIYTVDGVWLASDPNKIGVNFYRSQSISGSFSGNTIYLAYELPDDKTDVIIDYNKQSVITT